MKYTVEQKKLESLLDSDLWELLASNNAIIAGGAITSLFCNRDINDLDIYFRSKRDLVKVLAAIYQIEEICESDMQQFSVHVSGMSQRTIMCSHKEQLIQLMTFKYFESEQEIFDTFDFTVCMGAFDCTTKEFILHPDFFKHNSQRYLMFNTGTDYPVMSLMRVDKYREKGYTISKVELLRVLVSCMTLKLSSWEEAKEHIGGMYGYNMDKAFEEDKEFSLEELSLQLSTLQERGTSLYTPKAREGVGFYDLAKVLFYDENEILPEDGRIVFDDSKYLYKCTNADWTSNYSYRYKTVTYTEGSIIDVPEGGLFFHSKSDNPYVNSRYWVECEVLGGEVREYTKQKVVVHGGQVRVVRTFKHNRCTDYTPVQDYMIRKYGEPL